MKSSSSTHCLVAPRNALTKFADDLRPMLVNATEPPIDTSYIGIPTAFGVFAHQSVPEGEVPRAYLERLYNIQRWTIFPRGGHFAQIEEPAAVAADLIAFFHDLN